MDTIKKPEMLLGVGNTVAIIGLGIYFHKQLGTIKTELTELTEHLKTSVKKFQDVQDTSITRNDVLPILNGMNKRVEVTEKKLETIGNSDDLELLEEALESLSEALVDLGVEWDYPPRRGRRRSRRSKPKNRKPRRRREESESESDESEESESDVERSIAKVRGKRKSKRRG